MHHRDKRVADAIRDTVAEIVVKELADPRIGFVTITRCHISRDLRTATVYFSALGDEQQRQASLRQLEHAAGYIRRLVGQRVKLRHLPNLHFALDDILAAEERIGKLLAELTTQLPGQSPPPPSEPGPVDEQ